MPQDRHSPTEAECGGTAPERPLGRELALDATLHEAFGIGDEPRPMIARYAIKRRLGAGGMSEVFLANDPELRRQVAIKVLNLRFAAGEQRHLLREGWTLASVKHANVVAVHDVGFDRGRAFLVMEYIAGETLDAWLRSRSLPLVELLRLLVPLCEGLATIHDLRVVHRDLKPQNIIVGPEGNAKVIDFGLVVGEGHDTTSQPETGPPDGSVEETMSCGQTLAGTLAYMSPEQALARTDLDGRSDQFSLAVVIYEAAFGARPFPGRGLSLLSALTEQPPQRPRLRGWRDRQLWKALRRALAKDPSARFLDMRAFATALRRVVDRPRRIGRRLALALSISVATLLGLTLPPSLHVRACVGETEGAWSALATLPEGPLRDRLQDYSRDWSQTWTRGCVMAHREGVLSVDVGLPLRKACMREAEAIVEQALRELPSMGPETHDQLLQADLPVLIDCEAGPSARGRRPPALDDVTTITAIDAQIQDSEALYLLGATGDAESRARKAVELATTIDHRATRARARFTLGRILRSSEAPGEEVTTHLVQAANDAIADHDRLLGLSALHEAARSSVLLHNDPTAAQGHLDRAEAVLSALDDLPSASSTRLRASQHDIRGLIHYSDGAFDEAEAAHRRAIDTLVGSPRDDESTKLLASAYLNLSRTLDGEGPRRDALDRAYKLDTELYGSTHERIAAIRHSQALAADEAGHRLYARTLAEEALLLLERADHTGAKVQWARTALLLSQILLRSGHSSEAHRLAEEAEAIYDKRDDGRGAQLFRARRMAIQSLRSLGHHDEATLVEERLASQLKRDATLPPEELVQFLFDKAKGKLDSDDPNEALELLDILEEKLDEASPYAASLDMVRGWALAATDQTDKAIFSLKKGIAAASAGNLDSERVQSQWVLAEVLISIDGDLRQICELLAACRDFYGSQESAPEILKMLNELEESQRCVPATRQPREELEK